MFVCGSLRRGGVTPGFASPLRCVALRTIWPNAALRGYPFRHLHTQRIRSRPRQRSGCTALQDTAHCFLFLICIRIPRITIVALPFSPGAALRLRLPAVAKQPSRRRRSISPRLVRVRACHQQVSPGSRARLTNTIHRSRPTVQQTLMRRSSEMRSLPPFCRQPVCLRP